MDCTLQAELMRLLPCRAFVQVVAIGFGSTEAQSSVTISQENYQGRIHEQSKWSNT